MHSNPLIHMEYNTQLPRMIIPEYGRNIQSMIDHCCTIENREERNRCARAIIQVMGQLNPHLRDVADFAHKLWDHLFVISKFRLDVDSPYPRPSPETFDTKPKRVNYPYDRIKYKHYGKTIENIIHQAKQMPEGPERTELTRLIANHLKKSYINWNKDSVTDEIIFGHLKELSNGALYMDESSVLSSTQELRNAKTGNINTGNSSGNTNNSGNNKHKNNKYQNNNNNNKHKFNKHNRKY